MFSSTPRLLIRCQCFRLFSSVPPAIQKQQLLKLNSSFAKYLTGSTRFYNSDKFNPLQEVDPEDAAKQAALKQRRKTIEIPKITLLDTNGAMTVCTQEEATKIAEGRKLRLVNIVDMDLRSQRPVYKLMTEAQYLEEEIKEKKLRQAKKSKGGDALKGEKILMMSTRITEKDLEMKLNKTVKWIEKNFEVRITISGAKNEDKVEQDKIFKKFEEILDGKARILQKRYKNNDLKFQAMPPTEQLIAKAQEQREKKKNKGKQNVDVSNDNEDESNDPEVTPQENLSSKA